MQLEIPRLQILIHLGRVVFLRHLLQPLRRLAIAPNHVLELRRIVHVQKLLLHAPALRLVQHALDHVGAGLEHARVVGRLVPAHADVDQEDGAVGGLDAERVAAVLLHLLQRGDRDDLQRVGWDDALDVADARELVKGDVEDELHHLLVELGRGGPERLAVALGVAGVELLGKVCQRVELGRVREGGDAPVFLEYGRVDDGVRVLHFGNGDGGSARRAHGNCDKVCGFGIRGCVDAEVYKGVDDGWERGVEEAALATEHLGAMSKCVEMEFDDDSKVVASATECPVQI